ncbi:MAG: hypothetical protein M3480_10375 [Verrucomicrobiota bacterium]|nr:hypothetical protein [Chthoniobacterales bacterium]MDQ3415353.1 hypothetical protein [Verrucomicrobiota bacterium]
MLGKRIARDEFRHLALFCASLAGFLAFLTFSGWISGLQILAAGREDIRPHETRRVCFALVRAVYSGE